MTPILLSFVIVRVRTTVKSFVRTPGFSHFPHIPAKHDILWPFWLLPASFPTGLQPIFPCHGHSNSMGLDILFFFILTFFCWPVLKNTTRTLTALTDYSISRGKLIPCAHTTIDKFPIKLRQKFPICLWSTACFWGFPKLSWSLRWSPEKGFLLYV